MKQEWIARAKRFATYALVGCFDTGLRVRGHGLGDERVAADDGVCADDGLAAEDGRAGVDRGVVADGGVALAGHGMAVARAERAERHALIELDVVADDRRLADDDAGAVVDEEILADLRTGVDVNAGRAVGVLAHDARDERNLALIELVRHAVDEDRVQAGVGEDDLLLAAGGGVAVEVCGHVFHEHRLDLRQAAQEAVAHGARALAQLALVLDRVGKRQVHLLAQVGVDLAEQELRKRLGRDVRHRAAREIRREEHLLQVLDDLDDDLAVGHAQLLAVHGHFGRFVAVGDLRCHGVQQTFLRHDGDTPSSFT